MPFSVPGPTSGARGRRVVCGIHVQSRIPLCGVTLDELDVIYNDNLCLFRCMALHLEREVDALYGEYTFKPVHHFAGVTLDELDKVETTFKTNVFVYKLVPTDDEKTTAELVRRSMGAITRTR